MHFHILENAPETILLIFLIITFLQSGLDKVLAWKGNLNWLVEHFSKSPLKNSVPLLLGIVTVMELAAGVLCSLGLIHLVLHNNTSFAHYGTLCAAIALLMLFFGQRIAKDYEGAKTLVIYLVPTVLLLFLLQ